MANVCGLPGIAASQLTRTRTPMTLLRKLCSLSQDVSWVLSDSMCSDCSKQQGQDDASSPRQRVASQMRQLQQTADVAEAIATTSQSLQARRPAAVTRRTKEKFWICCQKCSYAGPWRDSLTICVSCEHHRCQYCDEEWHCIKDTLPLPA